MAKPENETLEHRQAFDYYLSLGAERSLVAVAEKFGVSAVAAQNWSAAFGWQERVLEAEKRIADKASGKAEDDMAKVLARQLNLARAVQGIFVKRVNDALTSEGKLKARGWKPSAGDAARWADVEREIMERTSGGGMGGDLPESFDGVEVEQVERVLIERVTRLRRIRKAADGGD